MKYFLGLLVGCVFSISCLADTSLNCWSGGALIYSGKGELSYGADVFLLKDKRTNRIIIANADCIISTDEIK